MSTTVMDTKKFHFQKRLVLSVFGMCWGSLAFGYGSAVIATTLGQPSFYEYMGLVKNPKVSSIIGAMNSLFYAGGFFGAVFNAWYSDRVGRRGAIVTACLLMILSAALCAGSVSIAMFIVFRFFTGWSCLMLLISVPLWVTETVPPKGRGILCNIHGLMAVIGYLIATYVGIGFFYYQKGSGQQWRAPLAFACLPPIITLVLIYTFRLPESPRYLLKKGESNRAWNVIETLHRTSDDPDGTYAQAEYLEMEEQLELDKTLDSSWRILVSRPSYRKRALIACALLTFIYSSGTLTVSNYGPKLFAGLGYTAAQALQFQGGIILVSLTALLISLLVVDRLPRNIILAAGMILVSLPLAGEAATTSLYVGTSNKRGLAGALACLYLYIFIYGIFLDGPGYYYVNEIFPNHLRSKGATLCVGSYALINILWTQVSPVAFESIGWKYYMVFISCCAVSSLVIFFTFPDTLNKPLEEVALMFGDDDLVSNYIQTQEKDSQGDSQSDSLQEITVDGIKYT